MNGGGNPSGGQKTYLWVLREKNTIVHTKLSLAMFLGATRYSSEVAAGAGKNRHGLDI